MLFKYTKYLLMCIITCCLWRGQLLYAQVAKADIKVLSYPTGDGKIYLRWAPTNEIAWSKGNTYGYQLLRYTVTRKGAILEQPEVRILQNNIKPLPLDDWETIVGSSDAAAIVAQAIYGETFEMSNTGSNDFATIMNQMQEMQQRFGFALYAMDQDFEVAIMAGLGYKDSTAKIGEQYLYRLISAIPTTEYRVDTGAIFVGLDDYVPLPKPRAFSATAIDKSVMLSWNYEILKQQYSSYFIERSIDSVHFELLSPLPVTQLTNDVGQNEQIHYIDSTQRIGHTYYYRIQGSSPFGIKGPYSEVVKIKAMEELAYVPAIVQHQQIGANSVMLFWDMDELAKDKVAFFTINIAPSINDSFVTVVKDISPQARSHSYESKQALDKSYYFTVSAHPIGGGKPTRSMPILVQGVDSVPPQAPIGIVGRIDSIGIAHLSWDKNTESDLLGYRIYKASLATEEFSEINTTIWLDNKYTDTVQLLSLNAKVYYKIVAVDQRFNNSEASKVFVLNKPDIVPPAPAQFISYSVGAQDIAIEWSPSNSEDLDYTLLIRRNADDTSISKMVGKCSATQPVKAFIDDKIVLGQTYLYHLETYDLSGWVTKSSQTLTISAAANASKLKPKIGGLDVYKDEQKRTIDIFWAYKEADVVEFLVYRAENDAPLTLWTTLNANARSIKDDKAKPGRSYQYAVQAQFADGSQSKLTTIKVNF